MSNSALQVARTGLDAQNTKMRVIANNLANVNTVGFKRDRADFETLAYQNVVTPGAPSDAENRFATGLQLGTGVRLSGVGKIDTQGTLQNSDNAMDLAIEGSGLFQVEMPDGTTGYTRAGNFKLTAEGNLVTTDGLPLIPAIQVPEGATSLTIANNGTVSAAISGQSEVSELGQIELANFTNAAGLLSIGNNILKETAASGAPQVGEAGQSGLGTIRQGALEQSNVNIVEELVNMIETQRAYEVNSKMISATDEMLQFVNQQM